MCYGGGGQNRTEQDMSSPSLPPSFLLALQRRKPHLSGSLTSYSTAYGSRSTAYFTVPFAPSTSSEDANANAKALPFALHVLLSICTGSLSAPLRSNVSVPRRRAREPCLRSASPRKVKTCRRTSVGSLHVRARRAPLLLRSPGAGARAGAGECECECECECELLITGFVSLRVCDARLEIEV